MTCCCHSSDARECMRSRYGMIATFDDDDYEDFDCRCECACHSGDEDGLTEWDHAAGIQPGERDEDYL
jgi:hypothetical protein